MIIPSRHITLVFSISFLTLQIRETPYAYSLVYCIKWLTEEMNQASRSYIHWPMTLSLFPTLHFFQLLCQYHAMLQNTFFFPLANYSVPEMSCQNWSKRSSWLLGLWGCANDELSTAFNLLHKFLRKTTLSTSISSMMTWHLLRLHS